MKYFLIVIILTFLTLISCENNVEEVEIQDINQLCNPQISFSETIKPIVDNNCVQCHHGNRFPDLRTYQSIKDNTGIIKEVTQTRRMPIGSSLSQTDINAIACWIDNGALNN